MVSPSRFESSPAVLERIPLDVDPCLSGVVQAKRKLYLSPAAMSDIKNPPDAFSVPMWLATATGLGATAAFYVAASFEPLNRPLLHRYISGHPVCYATVGLFFVAASTLLIKLVRTLRASHAVRRADEALVSFLPASVQGTPIATARWLESMWRAQPPAIAASMLGSRVMRLLQRQVQRGSCDRFDEDLQATGDEDIDAQYESYASVRIICWAMPMLGFLGTVVGISQTLGSMDMGKLASGDDTAMAALSSGLYIAFDTTAIALVLTIFAMFAQFAINGRESRLLRLVDRSVSQRLYSLIKLETSGRDHSRSIEAVGDAIVAATQAAWGQMIAAQIERWEASHRKIDERVAKLSDTLTQVAGRGFSSAIEGALSKFATDMESAGERATDALAERFGQWQTVLSDAARIMQGGQQELTRHSEILGRHQVAMNELSAGLQSGWRQAAEQSDTQTALLGEAVSTTAAAGQRLSELVERCDRFVELDASLQATLARMTDIDRFHEAAIALAEAIAVIGVQLEKTGRIPRTISGVPRRSPTTVDAEGGSEASDRRAA